MPDPSGSVPHNTARMKEIAGRLDNISQVYDQLKEGREFLAAERWEDVSTGTQAADVFIGNDSDSVDLIVTININAGGLGHITTSENASVDTSGTDIPIQNKGVENGTPATVEYGGTYTAENPIDWLVPGSTRSGGPSSAVGASASEVRLLQPGEGIEYTITNESGDAVDYGVQVGIVEIPIE